MAKPVKRVERVIPMALPMCRKCAEAPHPRLVCSPCAMKLRGLRSFKVLAYYQMAGKQMPEGRVLSNIKMLHGDMEYTENLTLVERGVYLLTLIFNALKGETS